MNPVRATSCMIAIGICVFAVTMFNMWPYTVAPAVVASAMAAPSESTYILQPDASRSHLYDHYVIHSNATGNVWKIEAVKNDICTATLQLDTDNTTWKRVTAVTSQGTAVLDVAVESRLIKYSLDNEQVGFRIQINSLEDGTRVYGPIQSIEGEIAIATPEAVRAISDVLLDASVLQLLQGSLFISSGTIDLACTYAACDALYPPGGSPSNTLGNCLCKCCTDSGGCWQYNEGQFFDTIGCGGLGWGGLGYVACALLCVPSIPFS